MDRRFYVFACSSFLDILFYFSGTSFLIKVEHSYLKT